MLAKEKPLVHQENSWDGLKLVECPASPHAPRGSRTVGGEGFLFVDVIMAQSESGAIELGRHCFTAWNEGTDVGIGHQLKYHQRRENQVKCGL